MKIAILIVLIVVNTPIYRWAWKWAFGDRREFYECLKYWFMPDLLSMIRGEYWRDFWGETKIFLFLLVCVGAVAIEYLGILMVLDLFSGA